jgi:16S rRNA (cytosine967-C5)-methyltransferase
MSRYHSYLNSTAAILSIYKGEEPFASFIKKHFAQHKKFGSKDRKQVSHLCYCYFRLGKTLQDIPIEERILIALFLCSNKQNEILGELKAEWNEKIELLLADKISLTGYQFSVQDIFSWQNELNQAIDKQTFTLSHLQQPDLFLRVRPGKEEVVKQKLAKGKIEFQIIADNCIALPNSSKIEELIELDKEAVVQDYSSQRVGEFIEMIRQSLSENLPFSVWDCCAASGGKSIMAKDILGDIDLTVSDIRESILINLKKRFSSAGINNYKSIVADLTVLAKEITGKKFDLILADVPCSGSGTWSRTPEQLYFFNQKKIEEYAALQKKIVSNLIPLLLPGGYLLYITCSVFSKENEEVIEFIKEKFHLEVIKMEILEGYNKKADTMFAALLKQKG